MSHFMEKIYEKKEFIENLSCHEREIEFDDTRSFYFINCNDIEFCLLGNVTNIFFENCKDCIVSIQNVIAKIELLRSSDIYIDISKDSPTPITIQMDIVHDVEIDINHPCMVQTISCMDIYINEMPLLCSMFNDIRVFELT